MSELLDVDFFVWTYFHFFLTPNQIESKFNELRLNLKTTEFANEDLDKYHKVV